ncbi:GNAT family N-acetyltransferase [Nocardia sp. CDC160]|uniref:GNAT family N-acetyltransferase n=1 Tax=Nocardia sp. CDC160 TaxID=3112166 RepID=UPI002DBED7AF|nr:GNAT family N-acetyltransferase [Nocardia sp. CDC160]MEC3919131.1 GNAT family N-acetyltransferase [Nocardia sp. CDC160]
MGEIREIGAGATKLGARAMLELRPRWETTDAIVDIIDTRLRPLGYRLMGVFDGSADEALSVMGFRESFTSAWGRHIYVDDLSTLPRARGRGYGDALIGWVKDEAKRLGCEAVHLDSGVNANRAPAHRLYMRNRFAITSHHFAVEV